MKAETPAKGISVTAKYDDAVSYRVDCECTDDNHSVIMWIETKEDHECHHVEVTFYANTVTPIWSMNRWRAIWHLLRYGVHRSQHGLLLDKQSAVNFAEAIKSSVANLERPKKLVANKTVAKKTTAKKTTRKKS